MVGNRVRFSGAADQFAGRHVVFTDLERDNNGNVTSGIVADVFEDYEALYERCKQLKCEIEVGFFGQPIEKRSFQKSSLRRTLSNFKARITSKAIPTHLIHQRHDNVSELWGQFINLPTTYPLICQTFPFLWLRDWFRNGGYSFENIDRSFLFQTAWLHRNTLHGIVKGDRRGIYNYAKSSIKRFQQIANGSNYRPVELRRHSGAHFEILDGHHRAAYNVLLGRLNIKANVVDINQFDDINTFSELERKIKSKGNPYYDFRIEELSSNRATKQDSLNRCDQILKQLSVQEDLTILDVGCHTGLFTILFSCFGFECHGINPSERELEIAEKYNRLLGSTATFTNKTLRQFLNSNQENFDIALALNMFYSLVREEGKQNAISQLRELIRRTNKYMFFSTSMPGDKGATQWHEFAMPHKEIVNILSEYGEVSVIGLDQDYHRNIYKLAIR